MALEGVTVRDRYSALAKLTRVSRSWHALVQGTPAFWAYVSSWHPQGLIRKALFKSKPYPLTIDSRLKIPSSTFYPVFKEVGRWHSLDMLVSNDSDIQTRLSVPAPLLEQLTLRKMHYRTTSFDIFSGNAPRLTDLTLQEVPIRWTAPMLSGLLSLDIKGIPSLGPTIGQILEVLSNSPLLRTLILERISFESTQSHEDLPFVYLRHLEKFRTELAPAKMDTILSHIQATGCKQLRLATSWPPQCDPSAFDTSLNQFIPLLASSFASTPSFRIDIGTHSTKCTMTNFDMDMNHTYLGEGGFKLLRWLTDAFIQEPALNPVTLVLEHDFKATVDLTPLFDCMDRLECVTTLEVVSRTNGRAIVEQLGIPSKESSTGWPLPYLASLFIEDIDIEPAIILQMIERRYGVNAGPDDPEAAPLAHLDVSDQIPYDEDIYQRLMEIMGGESVHWEPRETTSEEEDGDDEDGEYGLYEVYPFPYYG